MGLIIFHQLGGLERSEKISADGEFMAWTWILTGRRNFPPLLKRLKKLRLHSHMDTGLGDAKALGLLPLGLPNPMRKRG